MRIDPQIAFDNMQNRGIKGTTDWKQYEVELNMQPEKTSQIYIGGLMAGTGKMWLDDFKVTIDGKNISNAVVFERKIYNAEKDTIFNSGSNITQLSLDKTSIENMRVLGLVWGFVKYYHPNIAKGDFNWDYELFRILPKIAFVKNIADRDNVLKKWIESLGPFQINSKEPSTTDSVKIWPDLDWLTSSGFSKELSALLQNIKSAKRTGEHYYIGLTPGVANPVFKNENPYDGMKYPDAGYRLLSLYRYWNMIQYFFPYKNLIGEDWKKVLPEFIPVFVNATNEREYALAALKLIARVHDTHANLWGGRAAISDIFGERFAIPVVVIAEGKAVVKDFYNDSLATESGLKRGDIITKVKGKTVDDIIKNSLVITAASNYPTQLRDIARNLLTTNDTMLQIEYERAGTKKQALLKTYKRGEIKMSDMFLTGDTSFKMLEGNIAYINNGSVKKNDLPEIWKQASKSKGLIIDNRNYPSDFVIYDLSSYLMPRAIPFVKFSKGNIETPGLFTYKYSLNAGVNNKEEYKNKIVVLVNEISQSSSEFHAMAYRAHPNAIVMGSTTAGADGNVSPIHLPGGLRTMISGIGVYYPDGRETQRVGIVPDIEVKPTVAGIKDGKDEVLQKAIDYINGK